MSYRKVIIDNQTSTLLDVIKHFHPDLNVSELLNISMTLFLVAQFSAELDGEVIAKLNGQEFDLTNSDGITAALKVAHELLNMHDEQRPP